MKNILLFIGLYLVGLSLHAQTGLLRGTITDEVGLGLPGATIIVQGSTIGSVTDVDGTFILQNIPIGAHSIEIRYLGYQPVDREVNIDQNQVAVLVVSMEPGVVIGEEILILGDRLKGQAKALNQQKENRNITNIVAADQIGRFPDANIGDAMKRIPGITMQVDQGEARDIIVRGLAPQLNSVTLNGDRIPSAEGDNRNIQMDLIPAEMVQTIEVNKAVTPEMDGDAIGGSVNLVTRSAPEGFRLSATAASGLNFLRNEPIWTAGLIYGNRTADNRLGFLVAGSPKPTHLWFRQCRRRVGNSSRESGDGGRH